MKDRTDTSGNNPGESEPTSLKVLTAVKGALTRGREEVSRGARLGKLRLDLFQLKRDRASLFERLGREVYILLQEEQLSQRAEFQKPFQKIQSLETRIRSLEEELAKFGIAELTPGEAEEVEKVTVSPKDRAE